MNKLTVFSISRTIKLYYCIIMILILSMLGLCSRGGRICGKVEESGSAPYYSTTPLGKDVERRVAASRLVPSAPSPMTSYVWPANFHWHSAPPDSPFLQSPPLPDHRPLFSPGDDTPFAPYHPAPTRPPLEHGESDVQLYYLLQYIDSHWASYPPTGPRLQS